MTNPEQPQSVEAVVQRQLEAFNARDLDALLRCYAEGAELFEFPDKLLARGGAELETRFIARFKEPNLHAELLNRMVMGALVVDHERVTRTLPEGPGTLDLIMIYRVEGGRIIKAWSMPGPLKLQA